MWNLFPATLTHDGRKVPVKDFDWRNNCTDDTTVINSWAAQYPQLKFYGVPTGTRNNVLVLDVDVKNNGFESIKKYQVPNTMSQTTLNGGKHFIFQYPNDGKTYGNRVGFDNGLDVRGENGYIIYYNFDRTPIAVAPQWLLDVSLKEEKPPVNPEDIVSVAPEIALQVLNNACDAIINAPSGESNDILNIESFKVGQLLASNSISREGAYSELFKAAKERGKPDYEAKATIESGLNGGANSPITSPFSNIKPELLIPLIESDEPNRWTPRFFTKQDLLNMAKLRKPQLFKDWSTEDIHITTADGGTGKTTLKLYEAICLALGESFLGFECLGEGRTLFITGEDTQEKLGAMIGAILTQMGIIDDDVKVRKVMNSILVKKDSDLCLISKNKQGFIVPNHEALVNIREAIEDIKPRMIVFDPIASFWGSENLGNDMAKAVAKFLGLLLSESNACVEAINHMGKQSSNNKDMTQFAGRGGTGLPSHARVSRVLRPIFDDEYAELTGFELEENQSAMMCNVNKFSDGSPLYNKPFLIVREGYLFNRVVLTERQVEQENEKMTDNERIFKYIKSERDKNRYPTKDIVIAHFMGDKDKISKDRVNRALSVLSYTGHLGDKIKNIDNPDAEVSGKVFIVTDSNGKEVVK